MDRSIIPHCFLVISSCIAIMRYLSTSGIIFHLTTLLFLHNWSCHSFVIPHSNPMSRAAKTECNISKAQSSGPSMSPYRSSCFPRHYLALESSRKCTKLHGVSPIIMETTAKTIFSKTASIVGSLHSNDFYVLTVMMILSTVGINLERETTFGKALSAPLVTMGMALITANVGVVPFNSPIYTFINANLVALAVPLLLFDSNLRRLVNDTGTLLLCFIVGAISTIIGTVLTFPLLPLRSLGGNGWKVASALAARHIGGAINFVAVSETLGITGSAVSAAIAADNVVVALYFAMLFYLAVPGGGEEDTKLDESKEQVQLETPIDPEDISVDGVGITLPSLSTSMAAASCLVALGKIATAAFCPTGMSSLPLISMFTVIGATIFPTFFSELRITGTTIGVIFMQLFFAASGAAGSIKLVIQQAPSLFLFSGLQVLIHFASLIGIGRLLLGLKTKELYLASNACVGGPTTAAAMAQAKEWDRLVLPALMVGILGYATATPIALVLGQVLQKLPIIVGR